MSPSAAKEQNTPPRRDSTQVQMSQPHKDKKGQDSSDGPGTGPIPEHDRRGRSVKGTHRRIVLADIIAFKYLEEDPTTSVLERSTDLAGYQLYAVEQWACSRNHPTLVIVTYTGDANHTIKVGILSVPADENAWSSRLTTYFKALSQYQAQRRETSLGLLMVTNLSGFPSSLTLVAIPEGDLKKAREPFFLNEDLKRLGCSGRVGLTLSEPSPATQAKFQQLYRTSNKVPILQAVTELVRSCQIALMLFNCLDEAYMDGLLCDETERAINDWWTHIGAEHYNVEPSDGVLGPTTVSALIGALIGARNRLAVLNAPVSKDAFDVETMKRAIAQFQKSQGFHKSRRLDRETFVRLHRLTAKAATSEGLKIPKAVKSTVAELSGKGGEMVMELVGRDRAKLSEIETLNYDAFTQLVTGDRAKWLWHGKAKKRTTRDLFSDGISSHSKDDSRLSFETDRPSLDSLRDDSTLERQDAAHSQSHRSFFRSHRSDTGEESLSKQTVLRRAKGLIRGQHSSSKSVDEESTPVFGGASAGEPPVLDSSIDTRDFTNSSSGNLSTKQQSPTIDHRSRSHSPGGEVDPDSPVRPSAHDPGPGPVLAPPIDLEQKLERIISNGTSAPDADALPEDVDTIPVDDRPASHIGIYLRENSSFSNFEAERAPRRPETYYAPRLSFSTAEDAILTFGPLIDTFDIPEQDTSAADLRKELAREILVADRARHLRRATARLGREVGSWLQNSVSAVSELDDTVAGDVEQLQLLRQPRLQEHASLAASARQIINDERGTLEEAIRDVETLASKLEYELGSFLSKVEDLEGAVDEFHRQVESTEGRVQELVKSSERQGVGEWLMRVCFGVVRRKEREDESKHRRKEHQPEQANRHEVEPGEASNSKS